MSLSLGCRCKLGKSTQDLTANEGADVDVVTKNSDIGGRDGERNLGESRIERLNANDGILLLVKAKCTEKTIDLNFGIGGPDTDVVTVLICDTRTLCAELDMNTVTVSTNDKEFFGKRNGSRIRVLGVMNALRPRKRTR